MGDIINLNDVKQEHALLRLEQAVLQMKDVIVDGDFSHPIVVYIGDRDLGVGGTLVFNAKDLNKADCVEAVLSSLKWVGNNGKN